MAHYEERREIFTVKTFSSSQKNAEFLKPLPKR